MAGELILVAEDEANMAMLVEYRLRKSGFDVALVDNGRDALNFALTNNPPPSVCVLDVSMPQMTGVEVLQALRSDKKTSEMKVVLLSGHDDRRDIESAYEMGVNDYLVKPVDPSTLVDRVNAQLTTNTLNEQTPVNEHFGNDNRGK